MAKQYSQFELTSNPNNGSAPTTLAGFVSNFKRNFLEREIQIVPGLTFSQYETVKGIYFASHNKFMSGDYDDNDQPMYWYDIMTDKNDQSTKNINVSTKDAYIKAEGDGAYLKAALLRREFVGYAKTTGFGHKMNDIAKDLPQFGTFVWKKVKTEEGNTDVAQVELINLMNDPGVKFLKNGIVMERHFLTQYDLGSKKSWDKTTVAEMIKAGSTSKREMFLDNTVNSVARSAFDKVDETTPFYEVFEIWGEIPVAMYEKYKTGGIPRKHKANPLEGSESTYGNCNTSDASDLGAGKEAPYKKPGKNGTVYVMAIVSGVDDGQKERVLFCQEVDRALFPYKEVHYRRRKGRWLGVGNYELCFPLIEKANELTNRFFSAARISMLHLYQTRDKLHVRNVMDDLLDGDIIVTKSAIELLPTELRGFTEYSNEMNRIEQRVVALCNSFEVVTGQNLPSGTSFKLGSQQSMAANKMFDFIVEDIGLFVEDTFNQWLIPDFSKMLNEEHILELLDSVEDIEMYYNAKRKMLQFEVLKGYILENNEYPDAAQLQLVGELVKDQIKKGPKQIKSEKNYYVNNKYSVKFRITNENDDKKENIETVAGLTEVALANPAGLQDPRLMKMVNVVLESSGFSPLEINAINETPTNPSLNPAMQGGAPQDQRSQAGAMAPPGGGQPVPQQAQPVA